jgi:hypothetical protein
LTKHHLERSFPGAPPRVFRSDREDHRLAGEVNHFSLAQVAALRTGCVLAAERLASASFAISHLPFAIAHWLSGVGYLTLQKTNDSVQATVRAELVSWPKSRWRLALKFSDPGGNEIGRGQHIFENLGVIISDPLYSHETFQFAVPGALQALEAAQRWTLRIESLPPEPKPGK